MEIQTNPNSPKLPTPCHTLKHWVWLLIFVLCVGIAALGFVYLQRRGTAEIDRLGVGDKEFVEKFNQLRREKTNKKLEAAGWQTYRNGRFGFTFQLPPYMRVEEERPVQPVTDLAQGSVLGQLKFVFDDKELSGMVSAHMAIYKDHKFSVYAGAAEGQGWVFYDSNEKKWYAMNQFPIADEPLSFRKDSVFIPWLLMTTLDNLPVYGESFGDVGDSSEMAIVHPPSKDWIVDFIVDSGVRAGIEFPDQQHIQRFVEKTTNFRADWEKLIRSFRLTS